MPESRVHVVTFGCRANQYDSSMMGRLLDRSPSTDGNVPDVFVLNACTVTALADRKARQAARRIRREHPNSRIVLIGCLAEAVAQGWTSFGEADLLAGNAWKPRIVEAVQRARFGETGRLPAAEPGPIDHEVGTGDPGRVRAYLKVQDGCSGACAYCRPRLVRGRPRNKPVDAAAAEAASLVRSGFPEIVLTGINLSQYAPGDGTLADVVRSVLAIDGLRRLRLASINPSGLSVALLDAFAEDPRACAHFHVPLQSGDDRVLRRMGRGYTVADYLEAIDAARRALPHATFGTDVIVGFPGEDDAAFANTCRIVKTVGFVNLHPFRYSARSGTAAATFSEQVPERTKRVRADALARHWRTDRRRRLDKRIGSTDHVLVEERRGRTWRGYTSDYVYVHFISEEEIPVGCVRPVRIVAVGNEHLEGTID